MPGVGVMFSTDRLDGAAFAAYGQRIEALGLDTIWVPELFGREPFAAASFLIAQTERVRIGTSIANVYARDATAAALGAHTLAELSGGRFALGLGVSNGPLVASRGHAWEDPTAKLRAYLEAMAATKPQSAAPVERAAVYVAAHGPKMLAIAAELSDGIQTWLMPPPHTAATRGQIGADLVLNPAQFALLERDPTTARQIARKAVGYYVTLDYYQRAWRSLGYTDDDFVAGGSDRLIDMLVAWGDSESVRARIREHHDSGASHVVVVPLRAGGGAGQPDWNLLEALAE